MLLLLLLSLVLLLDMLEVEKPSEEDGEGCSNAARH